MFEKLIEAARTCYESGNPIDECCIEGCPNFDSQPYCLDQILKDCVEALTQSGAELKDKDCLIQQQADEIERLWRDVKKQQDKMIELAKKLPKRGEWVWKHRHHGGFKTAKGKCECGRDVYAQIDERYETDDPYCPFCGVMNDSIHLNYCPNCGAKMEVRE